MKKLFYIIISLMVFGSAVRAQWEVSAGMGLDFYSSPAFRDYVNANFAPPNDQVATFKSAVAFTGEVDYSLTQSFQLGFEYNIMIDSYSTPIGTGGIYEISYTEHRPSLLAYYVIPGPGYEFKFGGGMGFRSVSLNEKLISSTDYSSSGFGVVFKAEGLTMLGGNFFANVGVLLRYDMPGELSNGNLYIINTYNNEKLKLNSLGVGLKLGVSYIF